MDFTSTGTLEHHIKMYQNMVCLVINRVQHGIIIELKDISGYVTDEIIKNERPVFVKQ